MLRIGFKFPCNGLNRISKIKTQSNYRYLVTDTKLLLNETRSCSNSKSIFDNSKKKYSTDERRGPSGGRILKVVIVSAILLGGPTYILMYAKNDPDFRDTLAKWIPGNDKTFRIAFREEGSYFDTLYNFFGSAKKFIVDFTVGAPEKPAAPKPAFQPLTDKPEPINNDPFNEVRISKDKGNKIEIVSETEKPQIEPISVELLPESLVELEKSCGEMATRAIDSFKNAACALRDYNDDVVRVVESLSTTVDGEIWDRLKEASEKRKHSLKSAEENAEKAVRSLKRMYSLIDDPSLQAPPELKADARRNIRKILDDVDTAKQKFTEEVRSAKIADRFWANIKSAREHFNKELQILFPNIDINDKKFKVNEDSFDLFVLHMYQKVMYLQKEVARLQTISDTKIRNALRKSGADESDEKIKAMIESETDKEKRHLQHQFEIKLLEEKKAFDDEMKKQLKLQAQVHEDHLHEALDAKVKETKRLIKRSLSEQYEADTNRFKQQLAAVTGRLHGLDAAVKARLAEDKGACEAQMLWAACQALARAVKLAPLGTTPENSVRPLAAEIQAVRKAAPAQDSLVQTTIENLPQEAEKRGVYPEDTLRSRFLKVEAVAKKLALVPEGGAALPVYLLSYVQSFLLAKSVSSISQSELENEPIDVESLKTHDILYRARYWMDRGDFKMTLRYMNLLKGASRAVARDWMKETRILLETQQAVDTLIAYAGATSLIFLGGGDSETDQQKM